ncbi:phage antitermination Q family protein, partial [Escherichia coli 95.0943]
TASGRKQ